MTDTRERVDDAPRELPRYLVDVVDDVCALLDPLAFGHMVRRFGPRSRAAVDSTVPMSRRALLVQLMEEMCHRPDGLAPLVRHLEVREGNTTAIQRLKVAVAAWEVELFDAEEWNEVFTLLEDVRVPDLRRWYAQFLGGRGRPGPPAHCTEPWSVFLHAATLNARPGESLPCFQLLRQLVLAGDGRNFALADWADAHDTLPAPRDPEEERHGQTPAPTPGTSGTPRATWSCACGRCSTPTAVPTSCSPTGGGRIRDSSSGARTGACPWSTRNGPCVNSSIGRRATGHI
ncbi:hypothetical protein OQI_19080 [Streptomyces pharetrae CZA14]|uniref:Uncharacterized protein n=1 Tax=Streptomyces pharetrae CZA14 TaxID=1144883 RepID=A0ABX3YI58_9ACTN|nr:hypothetical protein OQI_19080 [Streptomyces pharetrae CZA14]